MRLLPLIVLLAACADRPEDKVDKKDPPALDRDDPQAVARAILTAYKAKDLKGLRELAGENTLSVIEDLIKEGEAHPRYKSIFAGFRWKAVSAWTGSLSEARYSPTSAYVAFGTQDKRRVVVKLSYESDAWVFEDVAGVNTSYFDSLAKEPQK